MDTTRAGQHSCSVSKMTTPNPRVTHEWVPLVVDNTHVMFQRSTHQIRLLQTNGYQPCWTAQMCRVENGHIKGVFQTTPDIFAKPNGYPSRFLLIYTYSNQGRTNRRNTARTSVAQITRIFAHLQ